MKKKHERFRDEAYLAKVRKMRCAVCGKFGTEYNPITPSHIQTVGSGGGDQIWNVLPMHLSEHRQWEDDRYSFALARPLFYKKLKELGWEFIELFNTHKLRFRPNKTNGEAEPENN